MADRGDAAKAALRAVVQIDIPETERVMALLDTGVILCAHLGGDPVALAASLLVREAQDAGRARRALDQAAARVRSPPSHSRAEVLRKLRSERHTPCPCCSRADECNGFGSDSPLEFVCPKHCPCHD